MNIIKSAKAMLAILMFGLAMPVHADDTIKVGVLHSLSGTMAISETTLKDTKDIVIIIDNKFLMKNKSLS